jgi:hypothetical protein
LENETYTIQGIEITFYSATLERNVKPAGYIVELEYALKNTNPTDATIQFSSHGNELHADGQIVSMAPQATWSKKYQTSYHLKSSETTDSFIAQFFANSSVYGHTTSGTEYQPVDFANLYSDQTLEAVVVISGYQDDNSDSATITLELK